MLARRFLSSIGSVGIDIEAHRIKILQLREHKGQLFVVGAGVVDIPPNGSAEADPAGLALRVRAAFASGRFTGRRCVVSLPPQDVCVQSTRLPSMPDEELVQAAAWEASQRFGLDRSAMEVDFVRTGATVQGSEDREEVLLIAASHVVIRRWIDPLLAAGLRPTAVETSFTAMARAFRRRCRREGDSDHVRAVVAVQASGSTVMILRGDELAFCKVMATGGEEFDRSVAEHLQMDLAAAQELRSARLASATANAEAEPFADPRTDRAVYEAIRPLLGGFVKQVMLCIRYYGVTFRGHPPGRIILTGSEAREPHLQEALAEHCKIPVVFEDDGLPLGALVEQIHSQHLRNPGPAGSWAVAAGLSLRGLSGRPRAGRGSASARRREAA